MSYQNKSDNHFVINYVVNRIHMIVQTLTSADTEQLQTLCNAAQLADGPPDQRRPYLTYPNLLGVLAVRQLYVIAGQEKLPKCETSDQIVSAAQALIADPEAFKAVNDIMMGKHRKIR